jgi:hypothetical protein
MSRFTQTSSRDVVAAVQNERMNNGLRVVSDFVVDTHLVNSLHMSHQSKGANG